MSAYMNDYQKYAIEFSIYPKDDSIVYTALGLCSEAGEVADKLKKAIRDGKSPEQLRIEIKKALGDVLWYVAAMSHEFDLRLMDVANANLDSLQGRKIKAKLEDMSEPK